MKKLVFSGCSYTAGNGWADLSVNESMRTEVKNSPYLWVNLCANNIDIFKSLELINVGKGGASNTEIFENTIEQVVKHGCAIDTVVCQWTSVPRYNFNVGFELWSTSEDLNLNNPRTHDVNLNRGDHWPREYITDLMDRLRVMHHLHWEIVKVLRYSNIIKQATKKLNINRVIFVNGMCPWDLNYFDYLVGPTVLPEEYTNFTKNEILNIESRSDEDIFKLYQLAHTHYQEAGGIDSNDWVNLYNSFYHDRTDTNFDQIHPGINSNQLYFEQIKTFLKTK
jgi:hypothetical protein